eukprot:scaffold128890_cov63-Attheya_sp.AAC.3
MSSSAERRLHRLTGAGAWQCRGELQSRPMNMSSGGGGLRLEYQHPYRAFSSRAKDPTARRPNQVCDPYGQSGKPLGKADATQLLQTLDHGWVLEEHAETNNETAQTDHPPAFVQMEFHHVDFVQGAKFLSHMAAVAHVHNHYPTLSLERRLLPREKAWRVTSTVRCSTTTLQGLSHHDFHICMMIDVEVQRPQLQALLLSPDESLRKHT